jgi:rod shape-determining protein MreD
MWTLLWQRLDQGMKWALPLLTTLLFIVIGIAPWPLPYLGQVTPVFVLITIYYWAVYRPDLFHPSSVFLVGLLYDAINAFPFGTSALVFVALHQFALSQRRFFVGHSFFMLWTGFALTALLAMAAHWTILSLWYLKMMPVVTPLLQLLLTILVFPVPAWVLIRLQRSFLSQP